MLNIEVRCGFCGGCFVTGADSAVARCLHCGEVVRVRDVEGSDGGPLPGELERLRRTEYLARRGLEVSGKRWRRCAAAGCLKKAGEGGVLCSFHERWGRNVKRSSLPKADPERRPPAPRMVMGAAWRELMERWRPTRTDTSPYFFGGV